MNQVEVDQKTYQMPPRDEFSVAHFITVSDVERSLRFYEKVFGGRIMTIGNNEGARGSFRSRTRGSLSTSGVVRHPTNQR
jgi:predicted enzyme related to lactoylglutathione lyase